MRGFRAGESSDSMYEWQHAYEQACVKCLVSVPILEAAAQPSEVEANAVPSDDDLPTWPVGYLTFGWNTLEPPSPRCARC